MNGREPEAPFLFLRRKPLNKTEQELVELGKKVAHNYRLIVGVAAFFYGCFESAKQQSGNQQLKRTDFKIGRPGNRKRKKLQHDVGQVGYDIKPYINRSSIYQGKTDRKGA